MTAPDAVPGPSTSVEGWADALAAPTITPAGGSAAAIAGALAAALASMVARLTLARERLAEAHEEASRIAARADAVRRAMLELAVTDIHAFEAVRTAGRLPRETPEQIAARTEARRAALREAARVQAELLALARDAAELALRLTYIGVPAALGDAASGVFLACAAGRSAYWAVRSNLGDDSAPEARAMLEAAAATLERVEAVEREVRGRLGEGADGGGR